MRPDGLPIFGDPLKLRSRRFHSVSLAETLFLANPFVDFLPTFTNGRGDPFTPPPRLSDPIILPQQFGYFTELFNLRLNALLIN